LTSVEAKAKAAILNLLRPRQGILGLDIYLDDIFAAIRNSDSNIEFIQLLSPTQDLILSAVNVDTPTLNYVEWDASYSGTAPVILPGTYRYGLGFTSLFGTNRRSTPINWAPITIPEQVLIDKDDPSLGYRDILPVYIEITWPRVPNAASYQIYGREQGSPVLLASEYTSSASPTQTWQDKGLITGTEIPPSSSNIPRFYPTLDPSLLELDMKFTDRNLR
jgi:hypothetical protein